MIREYKKGSIVPRWLLRAPRKHTHKITFGTDVKIIPVLWSAIKGGWASDDFICSYVVRGTNKANEPAFIVRNIQKVNLIACPYNYLGGSIEVKDCEIGVQITNTRALKPALSFGSP